MELELTENRFDATVVGTGLTQSILAAALSQAGKKVLHLDAADYYSSHWASLNLKEFHQFLLVGSSSSSSAQAEQPDYDPVHRMPRPFVHGEVFANLATFEDVASKFRSYSIDITPRVIYARGSLVDLMIRSGVGKYMEFRPVNDTYLISDAGRGIKKVPVSRSDVFQSQELSMSEKRLLMKAVQTITSLDPVAAQSTNASALEKLSEDAKELKNWYERPFIDYLRAQNTPPAVCNVLLYALAFADTDQMNTESRRLLTTHQATDRINLFVKSIGRYSDGAFLFPLYGGGEIPQAFSRSCAVFGGTYILRYAPTSLTVDPEDKAISGVIGPGNQFIQSEAAVCEPEYIVPGMSQLYRVTEEVNREDLVWAHAACILDSPLTMADGSPISPLSVIVIPPNVLGNPNMVRVLQVDSTLSVVPNGKFIVYLSTLSSTYSISVTTNRASSELGPILAKLVNTTSLSQITSAELPVAKKKPTDSATAVETSNPSASTSSEASTEPAAEASEKKEADLRPKALYVAYYYQVHRPVQVHAGPVVLRKKEEQAVAGSAAADAAAPTPTPTTTAPIAPAAAETAEDPTPDSDAQSHQKKPAVPLAVMPEKSLVIPMSQQTPCARPSNLFLTSPPSGFMDYTEEVAEAEEIFRALCPDAEFLPVPKESKKKPTFFEDDPEGLASLSDDEKDQADGDLLAEAAEAAASAVDFAADTATAAAADAVADGAAGSLLDAAAESVLGAGGQ